MTGPSKSPEDWPLEDIGTSNFGPLPWWLRRWLDAGRGHRKLRCQPGRPSQSNSNIKHQTLTNARSRSYWGNREPVGTIFTNFQSLEILTSWLKWYERYIVLTVTLTYWHGVSEYWYGWRTALTATPGSKPSLHQLPLPNNWILSNSIMGE